MKKLTEQQQELLDMLDDLFAYEDQDEAYYQLLLILQEIQIQLLKMRVDELIQKKKNNLSNLNLN